MTVMKETLPRFATTPVPNAKNHSAASITNPALLAAANATNAARTNEVVKSKWYISKIINVRQPIRKKQSKSPRFSADSVAPATQET